MNIKALTKTFIKQQSYFLERQVFNLFHQKYLNKSPIIIYGNQKSGTSAIASLLGIATQKNFQIDFFYKIGLYEKKMLSKEADMKNCIERFPLYFSKNIIKEPELVLFLNQLENIFLSGKFIHIVRNPFDNIKSILNRLDISPEQAEKISKLSSNIDPYAPLWDLIMFNSEGRNLFEMLIDKWVFTSMQTRCLKKVSPNVIKYEDFISNKLKFINDLCITLNLEVKKDISPFLDVSFQRKGTNVARENFFQPHHIDLIYKKCGSEMLRYDYS